MPKLTQRQQAVLDFIRRRQAEGGPTPSFREIARHFGFRSLTTVADHLRLLRRKGVLAHETGTARSLRLIQPLDRLRRAVVDVPLFGSIPAGPPQQRVQEAEGCISVDVETLNVRPSSRLFALQVRGDSMVGRHILDGDFVVVEHGRNPKPGDVVAALIDGDNTLKTFVQERGKPPHLRAENPNYPKLHPAEELVIQGVVVALIRKTVK